MPTGTRPKYKAATKDTVPKGAKVVINQLEKGAHAKGVRGFIAISGVGSGDNSITFRLPESEKTALDKLAESFKVPRAALIRCLLELGKSQAEKLPELLQK
jgi:ribbon-helix-helix CopG family protein